MVKVKVNDIEVDADPKDNCILAARKAGIEIPHYCWHESLSVVASCRMCLVEVGETKPDGTVAMGPKLVPGCQTPIKEGTIIRTDSSKVKTSQQMTLELLLLNHPLDCSICDQAGECYLQDYTYKYGKAHSRLDEPKIQREDKYHIGEQIALFTDRCVMCTRCVRFTREISGTAELQVVARGSHEEIDVFPETPCNNKLAGNVVDLCPVGALCSKDFLYKKRVWWLKHADSVCTGCSTGCSVQVDQNDNKVYRLRPRENPQAQGHFMCDEGRFGFKYIHDERRIKYPRLKNPPSSANATVRSTAPSDLSFADPWPTVLAEARKRIHSAIQNDPSGFVVVLSPFMTVEEAYLLASYIKGIDARTKLTLGPVPVVGSDDPAPLRGLGHPCRIARKILGQRLVRRRWIQHWLGQREDRPSRRNPVAVDRPRHLPIPTERTGRCGLRCRIVRRAGWNLRQPCGASPKHPCIDSSSRGSPSRRPDSYGTGRACGLVQRHGVA
ncbi:MAG: 2Fe-2S iron-sulfur cluster-binding protein [Pirellula sp.]|nr:2Fe-2S iron-sulfur cluster-binding protein [Pirellula sp.]